METMALACAGTSTTLAHVLCKNSDNPPCFHRDSIPLVYVLCALRDRSNHGDLHLLSAERRCGLDFPLAIISTSECCELVICSRYVVLGLNIFQWLGFLDGKQHLIIILSISANQT